MMNNFLRKKVCSLIVLLLLLAPFFYTGHTGVWASEAQPPEPPEPAGPANAEDEAADSGFHVIATQENATLAINKLLYIAYKRLGCSASFTVPVIVQGYNMANNGEIDGVISGMPGLDKTYQNLIKVDFPLDEIYIRVFAKTGSDIKINSWEELSGYSVGILRNRTYIQDRIPAGAAIVTKDTNRQVLSGLLADEYDVAVLAERKHETLGEGLSVQRAGVVDNLTDYLYLNRGRAAHIPELEIVLNGMRAEGVVKTILNDLPSPEINSIRTIIHLVSGNPESSAQRLFRAPILEAFSEDPSVEIKTVSLDIVQSSDDYPRLTALANWLRADCVSKNVAAIVVSGDQALQFLMDYYYLYFRNVPVVFSGVGESYINVTEGNPNFTGIINKYAYKETVEAALAMFPDTKTLYVFSDYTDEGTSARNTILSQLESFGGKFDVSCNGHTSITIIMEEIRNLPKDSFVIVGSYTRDSTGQTFTAGEIRQLLAASCGSPILSLSDAEPAHGSIGGKLPDYGWQGEEAAGMLKRLLAGERADSIPVIADPVTNWIYDYDVLKTYGIDEGLLPLGSTIRGKPLSIWESNPDYIATFIIIIAFFGVFIVFLTHTASVRKRDLLKNVMLQKELEGALSIASSANDAKSKFVANVSHEIRTPLTSLLGRLEQMLDAGRLDKETAHDLERVHSSGMEIKYIVDDLLDISKIEAGKFELIEKEYEVAGMIGSIISQNMPRFSKKPLLEFQRELGESLPEKLIGDEFRIKQICNNLLSNAVKFSEEGFVNLSIKAVREDDAAWLIISVKDTGIGIPEEALPKILTEYYQVNMDSNRVNEGSGLGLPLVKMIAEMMEGSIRAESILGVGSLFTVKVKQRQAGPNTIPKEVLDSLRFDNPSRFALKQRQNIVRVPVPYANVLIVDDVPSNLDAMRGFLKPYRMKMDCVKSGKEAIELVKKGHVKYDAIFMDHMMPEMDGVETAKKIRDMGDDYAANIPIIVFTAFSIVGHEKMFLDAGFQDFISKPIDIIQLDRIVGKWVRDKSKEAGAPAPAIETGGAEGAGPLGGIAIGGLDLPACIELFGGDEQFYLESLISFSESIYGLMEKAGTPSEDSLADYLIAIHGIRGALMIIHENSLSARAEELEEAARAGGYGFIVENNGTFLEDLSAFAEEVARGIKHGGL